MPGSARELLLRRLRSLHHDRDPFAWTAPTPHAHGHPPHTYNRSLPTHLFQAFARPAPAASSKHTSNMSSASSFCASTQPRSSSPVPTTRTPLLMLVLLRLLLALTTLPLRTTAFVLPAVVKSSGTRGITQHHPAHGRCPLPSFTTTTTTTTGTIRRAGATGSDGEKEGEKVLSLHTLEVPLQDDPGNYRTYLEEHFKGSSLLRWHLGSVDSEKGVAHAEVVIVSPPGVTPPSSS